MPRVFTRIADDNDTPTERGTYRRVLEYWADHCAEHGQVNTFWAELCCPGCGRVAMVGRNHTVAKDGTVTPSDVCPFDAKFVAEHPSQDNKVACVFHENIHLDEWDRPSTPRRE